MFQSLFSRKKPLTGAPAVRRIKTYSAQSGHVYRYYYQGHRFCGFGDSAGMEHVFGICTGRGAWRTGRVVVSEAAVAAWQRSHGRDLSATERYALAKMALFQAFDERPPGAMEGLIRVREADLEGIAATLGFD